MSGTIVLVTGATKGIGRGFVEHYLKRPDTTIIAAVRSPSSTEATSLCQLDCAPGSRAIVLKIDATSETDARDATQALREQYDIKRLDIVIANAGIFYAAAHQKVVDMRLADLQEHLEVNTYSVIRLFQATWSLLQQSSKPIFLLNSAAAGSTGGMRTFAHLPLNSYAASKALANFFICRLHFEHPTLISFAVHPGSVVTENRTAAAASIGASIEGISVNQCVTSILSVLDHATVETTSGTFLNVDGVPIPW